MRFLSSCIFLEGFLCADSNFRARPSWEDPDENETFLERPVFNASDEEFHPENHAPEIKEEECPDIDLYEECTALCRLDYLQCRSQCDNALCENSCLGEFYDCSSFCPCGTNCPNGCDGCKNEICKHILVMGHSLSGAFSISFDGSTKSAARITAPSDFFVYAAPHALIKGELYAFGGGAYYEDNFQKVMKIYTSIISI
ncbi:Oidioi.mRNA.OKI2018_I69.chr1.g3755.t1.cds [Oikopleura dioica]|uniref:Oidioi.mRNA.OKI2018_I69.chr1.g3755.t1.cds n=1 Tax=Oikopleura dioica TaxID=34765 RepID=A0ABN7SWV9_OIKDI|nr:Oidioi.mRNA.OKI2018_I69.chr1.g3755.t1.cds [Oikopleura dioica]